MTDTNTFLAPEAEKIRTALDMEPHPEGGWYRRTYTSEENLSASSLLSHRADRPYVTSIYFLISSGNFSAFHRLKSDEVWYHHEGDALDIEMIYPDGSHERMKIGSVLDSCEAQAAVPAGCWFASRVSDGKGWSLVGCAVAPGFDFADFELADRKALLESYPHHEKLIRSLTR